MCVHSINDSRKRRIADCLGEAAASAAAAASDGAPALTCSTASASAAKYPVAYIERNASLFESKTGPIDFSCGLRCHDILILVCV